MFGLIGGHRILVFCSISTVIPGLFHHLSQPGADAFVRGLGTLPYDGSQATDNDAGQQYANPLNSRTTATAGA